MERSLEHLKWTTNAMCTKCCLASNDNIYFRRLINGEAHHKIPKISPGASIFQRSFLRGLSTEGNLCFKIDWASLKVGSEFTVFALFYFVFEGNLPSTSPRGAYIWRGVLMEAFRITSLGGLFSEFYSISEQAYIWIETAL